MGRYTDGKIFLVHTRLCVPLVTFLFLAEAQRINQELEEAGAECFVKEVHCFSNGVQRVFAIVHQSGDQQPAVAFASLKDANNMSKILSETGNAYTVSEVSCFDVMRNPALAKYKLKFAGNVLQEQGLQGDEANGLSLEG